MEHVLMPASRHPKFSRRVAASASLSLALATLAGCAPGGDLKALPPYDPSSYVIGVGDRVHITTFGERDFQTDQRIPIDGHVTFPLIGPVMAKGATPEQLASTLSADLRERRVLRDAKVMVSIDEYRPVSVIGEVEHGGQFAYQPGMTLLSAVAAAGGFTYRAFQDYAYVVRQGADGPVVGRLSPQDYVQPNDVIRIYERHF